jgi:N-acetyl-gamma-glutamyl-phosphate reductase
LPELAPGQRDLIRGSKRISNPGCHSTAFLLLVRPLVDAGLIPATLPISATSITGYSGGGKKMIQQYESDSVANLDSPRQYALTLSHKHVPEMVKHAGLTSRPIFMPIVGAFDKGLSVSVPLHLSEVSPALNAEKIQDAYERRYGGERFVRVMKLNDPDTLADGYFDVKGCNGTNRVDLFVFSNEMQIIVMARLDNLGKGASGAAVQTMNVHLGVEEDLGL